MGQAEGSSSGTSKNPGPSDAFLLFGIGLLMSGVLYSAVRPWLLHFWLRHHTKIQISAKAALICTVPLVVAWLRNWHLRRSEDAYLTAYAPENVPLGEDIESGKPLYLKPELRTIHTQVIGTTNAGKTSSVILPWLANDIAQGRGCIIVDGKSERGLLEKLYSHAVKAGRKDDFLVFSLCDPKTSSTFNPFCHGSPMQIAERIFSSFKFENEFYRNKQFSALRTVISVLMQKGQVPMPGVIRECIRDTKKLTSWLYELNDQNLVQSVLSMIDDKDYEKNYSGLITILDHFCEGDIAPLYNVQNPEIVLSQVLKEQKICYFQLPTMQFPLLGATTGKLLLQNLQSAISEIQVEGARLDSLFSIYLDDFNDYIYPDFVSLLNKSRSANVGVVFSHQSLGDLEKVGPDFKQIVLVNTNIKIIMNSNDPESAEHFSKTIGTVSTEKTTERRTKILFRSKDTGEQSVRDVEEYIVHPNVFKSALKQGEAVVILPHALGRAIKRVKFRPIADVPIFQLPVRKLSTINFAEAATNPDAPNEKSKAQKREKAERSEGSEAPIEQEVEIVQKKKTANVAAHAAALFLAIQLSSGCSTTGRSIGIGTGTGAALGAGVGALADGGEDGQDRVRNVLIGSAIGAGVGAGVGYVTDRFVNDSKQEAARRAQKESVEVTTNSSCGGEPRLVPARGRARWVPKQQRGSTYIPAHFEYDIPEGARWEAGN